MHPIVEVRSPRGDRLLIVVDRRLEVGREGRGILIDDPLTSRRHLAISPVDGHLRIEDLGSSNGTQLNGRLVSGAAPLGPGDVVLIGDTELRLSPLVADERPPTPSTADDVRGTTIRGGPAGVGAGLTTDLPSTRATTYAPAAASAVPGPPPVSAPPPPPAAPPPPPPARPAPAVADAGTAVVRPTTGTSPDGVDLRTTSIDRVAAEVIDASAELAEEVATPDSEPEITAGRATGRHSASTLTIAFSDIEQSTEQAEAMGDHRWYRALLAHNAIIEELVAQHDGTVVKTVGDGFMVTFTSAGQATRWAIAVQQAITDYGEAHPEEAVRVRLGLHTGEAIEANGDLFGIHVHTAARVANLATGGQIVVSSLTRAIAAPAGEFEFGPERPVTLKGLSGNHAVSELLWERTGD